MLINNKYPISQQLAKIKHNKNLILTQHQVYHTALLNKKKVLTMNKTQISFSSSSSIKIMILQWWCRITIQCLFYLDLMNMAIQSLTINTLINFSQDKKTRDSLVSIMKMKSRRKAVVNLIKNLIKLQNNQRKKRRKLNQFKVFNFF